jgi:hypothetical protein
MRGRAAASVAAVARPINRPEIFTGASRGIVSVRKVA